MAIGYDGKSTEKMMTKAWAQVPGLWQLAIADLPGFGNRPADTIVLTDKYRILQEVKSTVSDKIGLGSLVHKHQVKALYEFTTLHRLNLGILVVEFLTYEKIVFIDIIQYIRYLKSSRHAYLGLPEITSALPSNDLYISLKSTHSGPPEMTKVLKEITDYADKIRK